MYCVFALLSSASLYNLKYDILFKKSLLILFCLLWDKISLYRSGRLQTYSPSALLSYVLEFYVWVITPGFKYHY